MSRKRFDITYGDRVSVQLGEHVLFDVRQAVSPRLERALVRVDEAAPELAESVDALVLRVLCLRVRPDGTALANQSEDLQSVETGA